MTTTRRICCVLLFLMAARTIHAEDAPSELRKPAVNALLASTFPAYGPPTYAAARPASVDFKIQLGQCNVKSTKKLSLDATGTGFTDRFTYGRQQASQHPDMPAASDAGDDSDSAGARRMLQAVSAAPSCGFTTLRALADKLVGALQKNVRNIKSIKITITGSLLTRQLTADVVVYFVTIQDAVTAQGHITSTPAFFGAKLKISATVGEVTIQDQAEPVYGLRWKTVCSAAISRSGWFVLSGQRCKCKLCADVPTTDGATVTACKCKPTAAPSSAPLASPTVPKADDTPPTQPAEDGADEGTPDTPASSLLPEPTDADQGSYDTPASSPLPEPTDADPGSPDIPASSPLPEPTDADQDSPNAPASAPLPEPTDSGADQGTPDAPASSPLPEPTDDADAPTPDEDSSGDEQPHWAVCGGKGPLAARLAGKAHIPVDRPVDIAPCRPNASCVKTSQFAWQCLPVASAAEYAPGGSKYNTLLMAPVERECLPLGRHRSRWYKIDSAACRCRVCGLGAGGPGYMKRQCQCARAD